MLVLRKPKSTAKQDVELLLNKLPDNCSVEDIQYHLYVLDKVRHGLEDAKTNGTLSQEDETRLSKWLPSRLVSTCTSRPRSHCSVYCSRLSGLRWYCRQVVVQFGL